MEWVRVACVLFLVIVICWKDYQISKLRDYKGTAEAREEAEWYKGYDCAFELWQSYYIGKAKRTKDTAPDA